MRVGMKDCQASAFAFSPLNVLPKIALGKLALEARAGGIILRSAEGTARVVPTGDRAAYYRLLLDLLSEKTSLALVPEWAAVALKKHQDVSKQHDEYVMTTEDVKAFPGGRNRQMRGNVNKARRLCTVEDFDQENLQEFKDLVRTWYRQNVELKFRTYDKTSIDWLLENWAELRDVIPDLVCLGIRYEGQLISLNLGCLLSEGVWTAYTQRFDRDAPIKHGNMLGYNELANRFDGADLENDGTADTKTIREWKDRLVAQKVPFFTVSA